MAKESRVRWWLWRHLIRHPRVCPASAHSRVVWGIRDAGLAVDGMCRDDALRNGACWCGKVRRP